MKPLIHREPVKGDVLDTTSIEAVMPGHDAILSALGVASRSPTSTPPPTGTHVTSH
jgi:putative NADH-flavin reductase